MAKRPRGTAYGDQRGTLVGREGAAAAEGRPGGPSESLLPFAPVAAGGGEASPRTARPDDGQGDVHGIEW